MHRATSRSNKSADGSMTFRDPPKENMVSAHGPLDLAFSWKARKHGGKARRRAPVRAKGFFSVAATTQCCANRAQGRELPGAGGVPAMTEALRPIRATSSREADGSMHETDLLRASVSPWCGLCGDGEDGRPASPRFAQEATQGKPTPATGAALWTLAKTQRCVPAPMVSSRAQVWHSARRSAPPTLRAHGTRSQARFDPAAGRPPD